MGVVSKCCRSYRWGGAPGASQGVQRKGRCVTTVTQRKRSSKVELQKTFGGYLGTVEG